MAQDISTISKLEQVWRSIEKLCEPLRSGSGSFQQIAPDGLCKTTLHIWSITSRV